MARERSRTIGNTTVSGSTLKFKLTDPDVDPYVWKFDPNCNGTRASSEMMRPSVQDHDLPRKKPLAATRYAAPRITPRNPNNANNGMSYINAVRIEPTAAMIRRTP